MKLLWKIHNLLAGRLLKDVQPRPEGSPECKSLPKHIAIIMDGNGRWAQGRGLPRTAGHSAGRETVSNIIRDCIDIGIPFLTLYSFSTENWRRPQTEVSALMRLFETALKEELAEMHEAGVCVRIIGDMSKISPSLLDVFRKSMELTAANSRLFLNLAINYSGRDELVRASRSIAADALEGRLQPEQIDESLLAGRLDTAGQPDPDLLIRTGGDLRVSNFLLWQIAYSEIWVTDTLWPDFNRNHLMAALNEYQGRQRRFGGVPEASNAE